MTAQRIQTLAEFLLARIAEDEAALDDSDGQALGVHVITVEAAARWLAECEAKRRIIEAFRGWTDAASETHDQRDYGVADGLDEALRALALPYADHPDYRDEWRPYADQPDYRDECRPPGD